MKFTQMFSRVKTMEADEARQWMEERSQGSYTLLDVRQPEEYGQAHIPGGLLVPLSELPQRMGELDVTKPVLAYWKAGVRSRSAANLLSGQGFDATSMEGGIDAWHGLVSRAAVDQGIYLLEGDESPEEALAVAYGLEEGARSFYLSLIDHVADAEVKDLFRQLSEIEVRHKDKLWERYAGLAGGAADRDAFEAGLVPQALEGGLPAEQVLSRFSALTESVAAALEFAMSLETDALDLYLRMAQASRDGASQEVFLVIAREERMHLGQLGTMLGKHVS